MTNRQNFIKILSAAGLASCLPSALSATTVVSLFTSCRKMAEQGVNMVLMNLDDSILWHKVEIESIPVLNFICS